ncbi:putrescine export ABC transporter permease SapB [Candidatus Fukatsuia symbiotica]|uniref:Antimicrobial peptide ABC transporter permease SapB n=1 Tax=Candidatus Fukatsuia symbiotica TaxID=1878942 RepID=A0A2U8I8T4_9GAMM|nr:putrescine export ABC transporter permease SapB [Candidatus Fukatsuia symbiotica]AWK14374.1 antimicrobial peptide ABC transporter permease SapB [Candidatus Fukatsuia symbiotica]MEA9444640.1 putrescine export ABC transporter permease SapB [Candidatus Fukatsuia symbiotica]
MIIFILRRLLLLLITLFMLSLVSFSVTFLPFDDEALNSTALIDDYLFYFNKLLQCDFGISNINNQPINEQLQAALPATMELCILTFLLALLIGIPLGILAGMQRGKMTDFIISLLALIGFSIPVFWLALLLMLLFSVNLGWLPVSGRFDLLYQVKPVTGLALVDAWLSDSPYRKEIITSTLKHMLLPTVTLAIAPITEIIRLMRTSTDEIIGQNYIKAAATRGLSKLTIIHRHLLHNALPPIIPKLGLQVSAMLTLAMLTEIVFNWPGLGRWLITAIRQQDYTAISAAVMVIGALVVMINVISDILGMMMTPLKHREWYGI